VPQIGESTPGENQDRVAAVIGHARAELREIAGLLATPHPLPVRRRDKLGKITTLRSTTGTLFPS